MPGRHAGKVSLAHIFDKGEIISQPSGRTLNLHLIMELAKFAAKVVLVIAVARVIQNALNLPASVQKYLP